MTSRIIVTAILFGLAIFVLTPSALAQNHCDGSSSSRLCDATRLGDGNVEGLLTRLFLELDAVIAIIAIGAILYSAFRMVFSRGDPAQITVAKASLTYAVVGLFVSVGAYAIVLAVGNAVGIEDINQIRMTDLNLLRAANLGGWITSLVVFAAGIFGTAALLMVVYQGFMYITARGNEQQATKAKTGLFWAVLGFTTASLAYVIVTIINSIVT